MRRHRRAGGFGHELDGPEPGGSRVTGLGVVLLPVAPNERGCRGEQTSRAERGHSGRVPDDAACCIGPYAIREVGLTGPHTPTRQHGCVLSPRHGRGESDGVLRVAASQKEVGTEVAAPGHELPVIGPTDRIALVHDEGEPLLGCGRPYPPRLPRPGSSSPRRPVPRSRPRVALRGQSRRLGSGGRRSSSGRSSSVPSHSRCGARLRAA